MYKTIFNELFHFFHKKFRKFVEMIYFDCEIKASSKLYPSLFANVVTVFPLISAVFKDAAFITVEALVRAETLISMWIPKGAVLIRERHLFEARYLLEKIRYQRRI